MTTLAGKTVLITGASRGIGRAIALRCAADGANIGVLAKTAEPHPTLPGTIFSVAEEIEAAGGRALPMQIDIRDDAALRDGVAKLAEHFGGIDILVNNASAISLSGIADTPMKRFDLMLGVNVRGTFAASQACIPYLKKAANPHVLTISPPLSAESRWFGRNAPHAISKFGMTMVAVGLAEELKEFGVASNALWPRALIDTDAVRVFFTAGRAGARKPELMADAAHTIVTKDSRQMTGHALLAEEVLAAEGVIDLTRYEVTPGASVEADLYVDQPVVALRTER